MEIDQLRTAAGNARDAAEEVGSVDLVAAVDGIATGMPGSRSAGASANLGVSWTGERDALAGTLESYAEGLESAADLYQSSDEAAAAAFG